MNRYTRARKYIDVNDLRKEQIKRKKIAVLEEQRKKILAEIKKLESVKVEHTESYNWREELQEEEKRKEEEEEIVVEKIYDWRRELREGMTTGSIMSTTLNATGDVDLETTSLNASSFDFSTDASFDSGTGSGFTGGFSSSEGIMNFSGDVTSISSVLTNAVDLSRVDTVNISAIAGNNSNGGIAPDDNLYITFILGSEFSDEFTVISKSSSSFSNVNITVPENFRKSGVQIYLSTPTGTHGDQGRALKPFTIQINGLNHATMGSLDVSNIVSLYLRDAPSQTNYINLGKYLWDNVQRSLHGSEVSENPDYPGPGQSQFLFNDSYTPAPVSGRTALAPTGGSNTVTDADYRYIGKYVYDNFKGSQLYGVNNISFKRKTPMNVIVSLDDPEVVSFIRTDPTMQGLSGAQREKKLKEMLDAGDEYLLKQLGMIGSSARPEATKDPVSWQQSADEIDYGTDLTPLSDNPYGTEVAQVASTELAGMGINPDTATPSILAAVMGITMYAATELRKGLDALQSIGGGYPNYGADAGPTTTGQPLPGVGENTPEQQKEIDAAGKELSDAQRALNDLPDNATDAQKDMAQERLDRATKNRTRLRKRNRSNRSTRNESVVYEKKKLKGETIMEKKKKTFKDLTKQIPGYYKDKPSPAGFPMDEPPKMVNGMHPDLIDGKKVADRFNKMDPISARSMPATGNPHIDKKVKAAAKKPK